MPFADWGMQTNEPAPIGSGGGLFGMSKPMQQPENWMNGLGQMSGVMTNGLDPWSQELAGMGSGYRAFNSHQSMGMSQPQWGQGTQQGIDPNAWARAQGAQGHNIGSTEGTLLPNPGQQYSQFEEGYKPSINQGPTQPRVDTFGDVWRSMGIGQPQQQPARGLFGGMGRNRLMSQFGGGYGTL